MLETIFSLAFIIPLLIGTVIGVIGGMALSRNSKTANAAFDQLRERAERAEEEIRRLRAKG